MGTSSLASEGKTTTISNIACMMTESNKRVLLIDLDLRKPAIHKQFKISNKKGITDLLLNRDDYKNYTQNVYPGLDLITAGNTPPNPTVLLNSNLIKELITDFRKTYDYIFLDTPPIILVSDTLTIARFSDAVILTIAYSEIERDIAKKSVDSLLTANANIIGTILNKAPVTKQNKYYYAYY